MGGIPPAVNLWKCGDVEMRGCGNGGMLGRLVELEGLATGADQLNHSFNSFPNGCIMGRDGQGMKLNTLRLRQSGG